MPQSTPVPEATAASSTPLPPTSLAAVRDEYGPPSVIRVEPRSLPTPGAGQVLLQVHAAGLDRGAWHLMAGEPFAVRLAGYGLRRPEQPRLGLDVAGTVVATAPDVTAVAVGDEVFGIADGSWAEHAVADVSRLAHRPAGLDPVAAAVSTVSGITALQALTDNPLPWVVKIRPAAAHDSAASIESLAALLQNSRSLCGSQKRRKYQLEPAAPGMVLISRVAGRPCLSVVATQSLARINGDSGTPPGLKSSIIGNSTGSWSSSTNSTPSSVCKTGNGSPQ